MEQSCLLHDREKHKMYMPHKQKISRSEGIAKIYYSGAKLLNWGQKNAA
jgi:hypothetical protein